MDQPPAPREAAASARREHTVPDAPGWESDLADLTSFPLSAVDGLAPLRSDTRLLAEVLRSRGGISGGSEPGRAE
ncbi:hypothetical protein GCM10010261_13740 [Streptomyces pilosus]|uniref:hypothetical protein n=1 Tax=Streptomyces pilosus TaxID=28893 RepID=UPI001673300B|nr:hypothetical protein [Streptomyces pilosus]GGV41701.1 hypothetical protein GCM10010261_13740 [Streptomyces pilosus]